MHFIHHVALVHYYHWSSVGAEPRYLPPSPECPLPLSHCVHGPTAVATISMQNDNHRGIVVLCNQRPYFALAAQLKYPINSVNVDVEYKSKESWYYRSRPCEPQGYRRGGDDKSWRGVTPQYDQHGGGVYIYTSVILLIENYHPGILADHMRVAIQVLVLH